MTKKSKCFDFKSWDHISWKDANKQTNKQKSAKFVTEKYFLKEI